MQRGLAVFAAVFRLADFPARQKRHKLCAVADAENGNAEAEQCRVAERCAVGVNAVGAAGEYDALVAGLPDFLRRDFVVRADFGVNVQLAHSARNQQVVLAAEIKNKYLFIHIRRAPLRFPAAAQDDAVPLGAYGNVGDRAADRLFDEQHIPLRRRRQVLPAADAGDAAIPALHIFENRLYACPARRGTESGRFPCRRRDNEHRRGFAPNR